MVREFCSGRCRAAFREKRTQAALRQVSEAAAEAAAEMQRLAAVFEGASQVLDQFRTKARRPRKLRPPAGSNPDLQKALDVLLPDSKKKD
jgi:hypothetical protein